MSQFPSNGDFKRLELLAKYSDLFEGKFYDRFGLKDNIFGFNNEDHERMYYMACNVTSLISEYFADMIVGDGVAIDVEDESVQMKIDEIIKRNNLGVKLFESAISQSAEGFSAMRVVDNEGLAKIEEIPENQYFPYFSGTLTPEYDSVAIASFIDVGDIDQAKTFLWKEVYTKENDTIYLEYEFWSTKDAIVKQNDKDTGLATYRKIQDKKLPMSQSPFPDTPEGKQATEYKDFPIYQINNVKRSKDDFGKSDYHDIESILNDISFQLTQLSAQLAEHGMSRLVVPQGSLDENGQLMATAKVVEVGNGEVEPKYIANNNAQIQAVFDSIKQSLLLISAITKIPKEVFGLDNGVGAETATAMRIRMFNPMRKVERKRISYEIALESLIREALSIEGIEYDGDITVNWSDVLPVDKEVQTATLANQVNNGLKSKRKAIKELQGLDIEDLDQEIADIANENISVFGDRTPSETPNDINQFLTQ